MTDLRRSRLAVACAIVAASVGSSLGARADVENYETTTGGSVLANPPVVAAGTHQQSATSTGAIHAHATARVDAIPYALSGLPRSEVVSFATLTTRVPVGAGRHAVSLTAPGLEADAHATLAVPQLPPAVRDARRYSMARVVVRHYVEFFPCPTTGSCSGESAFTRFAYPIICDAAVGCSTEGLFATPAVVRSSTSGHLLITIDVSVRLAVEGAGEAFGNVVVDDIDTSVTTS